jgi:hypothetical protein
VNCDHCGEPIFLTIAKFPVVCTNCSYVKNLDDRIDAWHDGDSELPLYEFLGMSKAEFNYWILLGQAKYGPETHEQQNPLDTE